jgi:hypothetical protein
MVLPVLMKLDPASCNRQSILEALAQDASEGCMQRVALLLTPFPFCPEYFLLDACYSAFGLLRVYHRTNELCIRNISISVTYRHAYRYGINIFSETLQDYNVTLFPPAGIVNLKKPPCAKRVQITVSVKNDKSRAALFSS